MENFGIQLSKGVISGGSSEIGVLSGAVALFSPWEMEGGCICIRKPWIFVNPLLFEKLGRPDKNCFPD